VVLQDRFRRALHQPETLVIIAGYSFSDAHLNELIFDAALRRERSEFITFSYSQIPAVLAERALTTPNLQCVTGSEAILGGVRGTWRQPTDGSADIWDSGQLALRDFGKLAAYLAKSAASEPEVGQALRELLKSAGVSDGTAASNG